MIQNELELAEFMWCVAFGATDAAAAAAAAAAASPVQTGIDRACSTAWRRTAMWENCKDLG